MRVGVIGCGYWGSNHVRVLTELPEVSDVVVIDERPPVLATMMARHIGVLPRSSLRAALDDIDALIVATPPVTHAEVAIEAMEAGKHVLVEKPMATSTAEALTMVATAQRMEVTLAAGHTFVANDAVRKLTAIVRQGQLGRLHHLDAARLSLGLYRDDVNVLWDLAAHDISITSLLVGAVPDLVSAWGDRHTAGFREDVASLRMIFTDRNVTSTVRASWLSPEKVRRTTVVGSEQMAIYDDTMADARLQVFDKGRRLRVRLGSTEPMSVNYRDGEVRVPYVAFREPLKVQAREFIECCLTGQRPIVDGWAGLELIAVLEAADRSLREHGAPVPVEIPTLGTINPRRAAA
ncbi:MAG: Gfo/Idh/MocA family oxidoreductase [Actinomycetota bacterium]